MVQTRSASEATERWESNAGNRQNYESGIESPLRSWQQEASDANERYNDAVRAAADRNAFGAAVDQLSDGDWQDKALSLGASRLSQGVSENTDKYESKVGKYIDVIEGTDLPARGPAGDVDANIERSRVMAQALADTKRQG